MTASRIINRCADVAVFYSEDNFNQSLMDSGSGMFFLPAAQDFDFNFDIKKSNKSSLGSKKKNFIYGQKAPDISLNLSVLESFETLFLDIFDDGELRGNLDSGKNFYFLISENEQRTVLSKYGSSVSIGNATLDSVKISQSLRGILSSNYSYLGGNIIAQEYSGIDGEYAMSSGLAPSVNSTGDQAPVGNFLLTGAYEELVESNHIGEYTAGYKTYVKVSGIGTDKSFLIRPDNVQSFDMDLNFNRKAVYSVDKWFPMARKATPPFLGKLSIDNKFSDLEQDSSFIDFLKSPSEYFISISGEKENGKTFMVNISGAGLESKNISASTSSSFSETANFIFGANHINILTGNSIYLWNKNNGTIFSENDFVWHSFV